LNHWQFSMCSVKVTLIDHISPVLKWLTCQSLGQHCKSLFLLWILFYFFLFYCGWQFYTRSTTATILTFTSVICATTPRGINSFLMSTTASVMTRTDPSTMSATCAENASTRPSSSRNILSVCVVTVLLLTVTFFCWAYGTDLAGSRICIAPHCEKLASKRSGMDHTVFRLQQHHTCLYLVMQFTRQFTSATTDSDNSHLIGDYYSFINPERMKGWVGLVGCLQQTVYPYKWLPSAAGPM